MLNGGDFFGEQAVIRSSPRTASVLSVTISHLLRLSRTDFKELLALYPTTAAAIRAATEASIDEAKRRDAAVQNAVSQGRRPSDFMSEEGEMEASESPRSRNTRLHAGVAELAALDARWWHFFACTRRVPALVRRTYSARDVIEKSGADGAAPSHYRCLCPCDGGVTCSRRGVGPFAAAMYQLWRSLGWLVTCGRQCRMRSQPIPLQELFNDLQHHRRSSSSGLGKPPLPRSAYGDTSWFRDRACLKARCFDHLIGCVCMTSRSRTRTVPHPNGNNPAAAAAAASGSHPNLRFSSRRIEASHEVVYKRK